MKKIFTLFTFLLASVSLLADEAEDWTGEYSGTLSISMVDAESGASMGSFDPLQTTIPVVKNADGTLTLSVKNLVLVTEGSPMAVGNVVLSGITATNPLTISQNIQLQEGDDATYAGAWMATTLNTMFAAQGGVPVSITATREGDSVKMNMDINIGAVIGYNVKCVFAGARPEAETPNYQMPNADFEGAWTQESSGVKDNTPAGWNGFHSAQGTVVQLGVSSVKPITQTVGYDGTGHSATIASGGISLLKIIANGNMTNGVIMMNNITAKDPSNHNETLVDNAAHSTKFAGVPDSVAVMLNFQPAGTGKGNASFTAVLHGASGYGDPDAYLDEDYRNTWRVAYAKGVISPSQTGWTRVSAAMDYNDANLSKVQQRYMLMSFATNETPGEGTVGDKLGIDHIRFIYNSNLRSLTLGDGTAVELENGVYDYNVDAVYSDGIVAESDGKGATVEQSLSDDRQTLTVTVKGNDYEATGNSHVYTFHFQDVTGLGHVSQPRGERVDVVTLDGVTLRRGVTRERALSGLAKGFYIVGGKKAIVK